MKTVGLILGFLFISINALAQEKVIKKRSDLKGPAYKNYNPSKYKILPVTIYTKKFDKKLMGPEYKNYNHSKESSNVKYVAINVTRSERQKLMGPAYKNYKH